MSVIRAFIAISLSSEIYQQLDQVLAGLKSKLPGGFVRWVPAKNIHLTIKIPGRCLHLEPGNVDEGFAGRSQSSPIF